MFSYVYNINGKKWLFFAVDHGPRSFFESVSDVHVGSPVCSGPSDGDDEFSVKDFLILIGVDGVVLGTSESKGGYAAEYRLVECAMALNLKVIFFEDYVGSFSGNMDEYAHSLVVESELAKQFHQRNNQSKYCSIIVASGLRYGSIERISDVRHNDVPSILWVGQPEHSYCSRTLINLASDLSQKNVHVYVKPHPRDPYYSSSFYTDLLANVGISSTDVSTFSRDEILNLGCLFSVTQFSSYSLELMAYGLPSLHVLYPDVGGELLFNIKGYKVPPICIDGGSALVDSELNQKLILELLLSDVDYRSALVRKGADYFSSNYDVKSMLEYILR